MATAKKGVPKRDGSGKGTRKNINRGGCDTPKNKKNSSNNRKK